VQFLRGFSHYQQEGLAGGKACTYSEETGCGKGKHELDKRRQMVWNKADARSHDCQDKGECIKLPRYRDTLPRYPRREREKRDVSDDQYHPPKP